MEGESAAAPQASDRIAGGSHLGVPADYKDVRTVGDLLDAGYEPAGARQQMRHNLMVRLRQDSERYSGIVGLQDDVLPALDRAILAMHDVLLVGQIGQAKTRLAQVVSSMLSPMPIIRGSITNDAPTDLPAGHLDALLQDRDPPASGEFYVSPESSEYIRDNGRDARIEWMSGERRSKFIVATPDVTVKDLVGYIDVVKVAKKGVEMYDIQTYSPGYLMQAKHGILCIDELPVLDARKQVALLSVLQEGLFTAGSYPVVFRPRTILFATANPVDYTHSGRIIEPLYDRLKSHIRTRYPGSIQDEMDIILQEARLPGSAAIPELTVRILADVVRRLRASPLVNQEKGVSVRMGIHGLELLAAEALRARPAALACPRMSDMACLVQVARFELSEIDDTPQNRHDTLRDIIEESIRGNRIDMGQDDMDAIKSEFEGRRFSTSSDMMPEEYDSQLADFPALRRVVERTADDAISGKRFRRFAAGADSGAMPDGMIRQGMVAATAEGVLEGLCWSEPRILERRDSAYVSA